MASSGNLGLSGQLKNKKKNASNEEPIERTAPKSVYNLHLNPLKPSRNTLIYWQKATAGRLKEMGKDFS